MSVRVELILLLNISAAIAIAAKMARKIKPGNSGITSGLINTVLAVEVPPLWLALPPLLPPPSESHIMTNAYVLSFDHSISFPSESPLFSGFFNSTVTRFEADTMIAPVPSWIESAEISP